jgi:hypothetical protein
MRRFVAVFAGLLMVLFAPVPAQAAVDHQLTTCSAEFHLDDQRLGPAELPVFGRVGLQLLGYHRTGHEPVDDFLDEYYDDVAGAWRYPPADGYVLEPDGDPVKWTQTLFRGQQIDRYGSEFGAFLAPVGLPYTMRSIPPSNLVGVPAAGCNYRVYQVLRPFDVTTGPIAPWFNQFGGGLQYQLTGVLVPGAPSRLNVLWLVENGYLGRVVSPST